MKAPDSLKDIINGIIDRHWEDILVGKDFNEVIYDPSYNICKIKIHMKKDSGKDAADTYSIRIVTKWFM